MGSKLKNPKKADALLVLIRGTMAATDVEHEEVASEAGVGNSTLYNRFKRPEDFTVGELLGIAKILGIPKEDLFAAACRVG